MPVHQDRKTYLGKDVGLPEVELFGWATTASATDSRLTRHRHPGAFEICLIARGCVHWWARNESYNLKRGSVYITVPNELHGGIDGVMHPCELYWLILPLASGDRYPGLTAKKTQFIIAKLQNLKLRTFPASPSFQACFARLHEELAHPDELSSVVARGLLHQLLAEAIRDHDVACHAPQTVTLSRPVETALNWINQHLGAGFSVGDLASRANMSVSRFHERFVNEVGLTPTEYVTWARVMRAKSLLVETSMTVSNIGFELGFSSSQYFATVFKKFVGMSPVDYRLGHNSASVAATL